MADHDSPKTSSHQKKRGGGKRKKQTTGQLDTAANTKSYKVAVRDLHLQLQSFNAFKKSGLTTLLKKISNLAVRLETALRRHIKNEAKVVDSGKYRAIDDIDKTINSRKEDDNSEVTLLPQLSCVKVAPKTLRRLLSSSGDDYRAMTKGLVNLLFNDTNELVMYRKPSRVPELRGRLSDIKSYVAHFYEVKEGLVRDVISKKFYNANKKLSTTYAFVAHEVNIMKPGLLDAEVHADTKKMDTESN